MTRAARLRSSQPPVIASPTPNSIPPVVLGASPNATSGGFELRRFAGPAIYAKQMSPIRLVHLTDQHVGRVTPMRVQRQAVRLANAQNPDLVALTGDFVCHSQSYLDALTEIVASFEAPVLCVLGNHDHWSGADEVRWALRRAGAEVLDNAHTVVTVRGQPLQVVGLDDAYTGHADVALALRGLRRDLPTLGLSHIAEQADALWHGGVPLVLSGHTHAGQVTLARIHELAIGKLVGHRYVHGLYGSRQAQGKGAVYVGAGVGSAVLPIRLGARARREVTIFELGELPGAFVEADREQRPLKGRPVTPRTAYRRAVAEVVKAEKRSRR